MHTGIPRLVSILTGLMVLGLSLTVQANPRDYPEFAQHKIDDEIPIEFITADMVKQHLDDKTPQMLVDVRDRASYNKSHLPNAVSIPLRDLPYRAAEIPRDIPVVLY